MTGGLMTLAGFVLLCIAVTATIIYSIYMDDE